MSTLHITRGIQASGKSTFARAWVADPTAEAPRARVNRDDMRMVLFGKDRGLTFEQEETVTSAQHGAVRSLLKSGRDVIVDDTNLRTKFVKQLMRLAAAEHDIVFHDFPVRLEDAISRDAKRPRPVGEDVIRDYYERFTRRGKLPAQPVLDEMKPSTEFIPYVPNPDLQRAYIFDIDGTLAHIAPGGRSPYDMTRVSEDVPDKAVRGLLRALEDAGFAIVLVSGRNECARADTAEWMRANGINFDALFMRADGDERGDDVVKHEILHRDIAPHFRICGVFDDRRRVVEMWRSVGLKCYQVQDGDF